MDKLYLPNFTWHIIYADSIHRTCDHISLVIFCFCSSELVANIMSLIAYMRKALLLFATRGWRGRREKWDISILKIIRNRIVSDDYRLDIIVKNIFSIFNQMFKQILCEANNPLKSIHWNFRFWLDSPIVGPVWDQFNRLGMLQSYYNPLCCYDITIIPLFIILPL